MTAARTKRLVHVRGVGLLMTQIKLNLRTQPVDATHMNSSLRRNRLKTKLNVGLMPVLTKMMATEKGLVIKAIHGTIQKSSSHQM